VLLPIVLYLLHLFRDRDAFFFYINLGLSTAALADGPGSKRFS
jgi:hypothetical protein